MMSGNSEINLGANSIVSERFRDLGAVDIFQRLRYLEAWFMKVLCLSGRVNSGSACDPLHIGTQSPDGMDTLRC